MTNTRLLVLTGILLTALSVLLFFVSAKARFEATRKAMVNRGAEVNGTSLRNLDVIWPVDSKEFHAQQAPADSSEAFRKTFAACAANGGRVFISPGYWWVPKLKGNKPVGKCSAYGLGSQSRIDTMIDFSPMPPASPRLLMDPNGGKCFVRDATQLTMPFPMRCP